MTYGKHCVAMLVIVGALVSMSGPAIALPHCEDSRHDAEYTYKGEILCVCAVGSQGCDAVSAQTCLNYPPNTYHVPAGVHIPDLVTVAPNVKVCVYTFGAVNHPADQSNGRPKAYWAQRITPVVQSSKPDSFTADCAAVRAMGFQTSTVKIHRAGATSPRSGSFAIPGSTYAVGPLRQYGVAATDRFLIDSFPLEPRARKNVCQIDVVVHGNSPDKNNDSVNVFAPKALGLIQSNGQWNTAIGSVLGGMALATHSGAWTFNLTITGTGAMGPALQADASGPVRAFDLVAHDDSKIRSATFTYTVY